MNTIYTAQRASVERQETRCGLEESVEESVRSTIPNAKALEKLGFKSTTIHVHGDSYDGTIQDPDTLEIFTRKNEGGLEVLTFQEVDGTNQVPHVYRSSNVMEPQEWYDRFSTHAWQKKNAKRVAILAPLASIPVISAIDYSSLPMDDYVMMSEFGMIVGAAVLGTGALISLGHMALDRFYPLRKQEIAKGADALWYIAKPPIEKEPTKLQRVWDNMNTPIGELWKRQWPKVRIGIENVEEKIAGVFGQLDKKHPEKENE